MLKDLIVWEKQNKTLNYIVWQVSLYIGFVNFDMVANGNY